MIDMGDGPDSLDGKRLHREMQHKCGVVTAWHYHPKGGTVPGADFNFNLPWIYPSGCVEKAVVAAGGVNDFKCWVRNSWNNAGILKNTRARCFVRGVFFFGLLYCRVIPVSFVYNRAEGLPGGYNTAESRRSGNQYDTDTDWVWKPLHRFGCV